MVIGRWRWLPCGLWPTAVWICSRSHQPPLYRYRYTVPKIIDFPPYNMECGAQNEIQRGIFHVVSRFLYISCYIAEIWITSVSFWTVYGVPAPFEIFVQIRIWSLQKISLIFFMWGDSEHQSNIYSSFEISHILKTKVAEPPFFGSNYLNCILTCFNGLNMLSMYCTSLKRKIKGLNYWIPVYLFLFAIF